MKKVGIITINSSNFGNRLQNYALQEILKGLGLDVYTICRKAKQKNFVKNFLSASSNMLRRVIGTRGGQYSKFNKDNIRYSCHWASLDEYEENIADYFDYFIAGSDQIWNPYFQDVPTKIVGACDFLVFARNEQKIAYAASFGVNFIPMEKKNMYHSALKDFTAISVREHAGAGIIKDLMEQRVPVVLDPTLLLSAEDWRKIEKKPAKIKKSYVLVYELKEDGGLLRERVSQIEEERLIDILKTNSKGRLPAYGPAEFLYLVDHADEVWTNSFHATVFSIIFHKPVKAFPRNGIDMSSRILSLADMLGLKDNIDKDGVFEIDAHEDFAGLKSRLEGVKRMSIDFLRKSLGIEV